MFKTIIRTIQFAIAVFFFSASSAQLTVTGPACAIPGIVYQYNISNAGKWAANATMKVCLTGGIIADQQTAKRKGCTDNDAPLSAVWVIWTQGAKASITVSSSAGSKTMSVNLAQPLVAGTISNPLQQLYDTTSTPASIQCSPVSGGSCSPAYSYQWQLSPDGLLWMDVAGATGQALTFADPQKQSGYYRRMVKETGSGTIAYSDIATVNVFPQVMADSNQVKTDSATTGIMIRKNVLPDTDAFDFIQRNSIARHNGDATMLRSDENTIALLTIRNNRK